MSGTWTTLDSEAAREIIAERREKAMEMAAIAEAYPPGHAARKVYSASAEYAATTALQNTAGASLPPIGTRAGRFSSLIERLG